MSQPASYFGIAGVTTQQQASNPLLYPPGKTLVSIGVLANHDTLLGRRQLLNDQWYPLLTDVRAIFSAAPAETLGILHYHGFNDDTLPGSLAYAMHWAGGDCRGVQLNITWPLPGSVYRFKVRHPHKLVVLRLGGRALRERLSPFHVARRCLVYRDEIDYVLLDPSGGTGTEVTLDFAVPYLDELGEAFGSRIGLGVAGGFGPDTNDVAMALLERYPGISIDAQKNLRDGLDQLDPVRVHRHLTQLQSVRRPAP